MQGLLTLPILSVYTARCAGIYIYLSHDDASPMFFRKSCTADKNPLCHCLFTGRVMIPSPGSVDLLPVLLHCRKLQRLCASDCPVSRCHQRHVFKSRLTFNSLSALPVPLVAQREDHRCARPFAAPSLFLRCLLVAAESSGQSWLYAFDHELLSATALELHSSRDGDLSPDSMAAYMILSCRLEPPSWTPSASLPGSQLPTISAPP